MTKELLRWEDSPGLEHHCPKCQTPLNNPRAKHTCYLKHVEICPLFHQHFFMIGQAHNCDTCRRFNSAHDQRHRALALLLRQFRQLQQDNGIEPSACPPSPYSPFTPNIPNTPTTPTTATEKRGSTSWNLDMDPESTPKLKKRERKKAKKRIKALKGGDALTTPEVAAIAAALHPPTRSDSASSASSTETTATATDSSTGTSNQSTDSDDSMLCPATPTSPTSPTTPITENTSFNTLMNANKAFYPDVNGKLNSTRMALQTQLLGILDESTCPLDISVSNALRALNIPDIDARMPKCVVEIVAKIKDAVNEDIFCAECDQKKYRLRQAGWYRFVNRSVLALGEEE